MKLIGEFVADAEARLDRVRDGDRLRKVSDFGESSLIKVNQAKSNPLKIFTGCRRVGGPRMDAKEREWVRRQADAAVLPRRKPTAFHEAKLLPRRCAFPKSHFGNEKSGWRRRRKAEALGRKGESSDVKENQGMEFFRYCGWADVRWSDAGASPIGGPSLPRSAASATQVRSQGLTLGTRRGAGRGRISHATEMIIGSLYATIPISVAGLSRTARNYVVLCQLNGPARWPVQRGNQYCRA
jgi:hypothetical protein